MDSTNGSLPLKLTFLGAYAYSFVNDSGTEISGITANFLDEHPNKKKDEKLVGGRVIKFSFAMDQWDAFVRLDSLEPVTVNCYFDGKKMQAIDFYKLGEKK